MDPKLFNFLFGAMNHGNALSPFFQSMSHTYINPLPHMPILGSSNSAANKDMMSKILINGDTIS